LNLLPMHQFTTSDGATLEYFDDGEGQPLVFIAGYRASAQTWLPQAEYYKDRYRVIGMERRFNGNTVSPTYNKTMARQGEDLHDLIEILQLKKPIVVGWPFHGWFNRDGLLILIRRCTVRRFCERGSNSRKWSMMMTGRPDVQVNHGKYGHLL
jgi:Predicted hydrolases or acyltransferases (alpha/beta hydrolase superfamily)